MLQDNYSRMFFILSILIYGAGHAIGWLALSLALGRSALVKEDIAPKTASLLWAVASMAIAAFLCHLYPGWALALPD